MALQMNYDFHGLTVTGAYHKVGYISGSKDKLNIDVKVYKDAAAASADPMDNLDSFSFSIQSGDLIHDDGASDKNYTKQAYSYLKAGVVSTSVGDLDFSGATDV